MKGVDSHVPRGESDLHSETNYVENGAEEMRPCCLLRVLKRLFQRGAAKKTPPYHNTRDFAQFDIERESLRKQIVNATRQKEQAKREVENALIHTENITRERNALKTKCKNLQSNISIVSSHKDLVEAKANKALDDLQTTNKYLLEAKDETRNLASKYDKAVKDKISQDQEYQVLLEKFEIQKKENSALNEELKVSEIRRISAPAKITTLQQNLEASEKLRQHHEGLAAKFRTILRTPNMLEVDDTVIAQEFGWLQLQIEHITYTYYSVSKPPSAPQHATLRNAQMRLCQIFKDETREDAPQARVRAFVFQHLAESLLLKESFGLQDTNLAMEQELRNFETSFSKQNPDRYVGLAEWRTVTMKCAQYLQPANPSHPPRICMNVADEFMYLLAPMREWQELCMRALKLTMKLRTYKDVYRCEIPTWGEVFRQDDVEPELDIYTAECKRKTELDDSFVIAYGITGTLVKYPFEQPEKRVVVVKPCVAVQAHPDDD